jgi:hypothetical protein
MSKRDLERFKRSIFDARQFVMVQIDRLLLAIAETQR